MKASTVLWMVAALALVPSVASAEDVIVRPPGVTIQPPGVTIERRDRGPGVEERESTGAGPRDEDDNCRRTTVHKEDDTGRTTTIRKKECD